MHASLVLVTAVLLAQAHIVFGKSLQTIQTPKKKCTYTAMDGSYFDLSEISGKKYVVGGGRFILIQTVAAVAAVTAVAGVFVE